MNIYTTTTMLNDLLISHELQKKLQLEELEKLPPGKLGFRPGKKKGQVYYFQDVDGKRKSLTGDMEKARLLARKKYLTASLGELEQNIAAIQSVLTNYTDLGKKHIVHRFPPEYAWLMDEEEAIWSRKKRQWMAEDFQQSDFLPKEKVHLTSRGLAVRSKSEVIVAERLDYYDIPYRYEEALGIRQYLFAPDFTILTKKGLLRWEHCGKVNDSDYMRKHNWKLGMYASIGIVPWKNLIVTYDDEDGNLDARVIESEIINKILPYC